jgi:hypothetical protein
MGSARTVDSNLLTSHFYTPLNLANFWIHGVFLPESTNSSDSLLSACSVARRWLLESLNKIDDLTARSKNIIGRELPCHTRWTASTARTDNPSMPHTTIAPPSLTNSPRGAKKYAWTCPPLVRGWDCYTGSLHNSVNSDRTAPRHLEQPLPPTFIPY